MLNIINNEEKIIKEALRGRYDIKNISIILKLLTKYYYIKGVKEELKLREEVLNFLETNYKNYKRCNWQSTVYGIVNKFLKSIKIYKIEPKLIKINEVKITKLELENIKNLNNIKLEKIAFIMLVYGKISNQLNNKYEETWVNQEVSNILKESKINANKYDKQLLFYELSKKGYIKECNNITKCGFKINYINEDSEVGMVIIDFDDVVYQYLIWKGERWKKCNYKNEHDELCSKWFKLKSVNSKQKYCNSCAKKVLQDQKNKWKREKWQ